MSDTSITKAAYNQFNNRVAVSDHTAATVTSAPTDYSTSLSFSGSLTVTDDAATVTTANLSIDALANVGSTFALTAATNDALIGTALNDTFTATTATDDATDIMIDQSTTDHDVLNWTATDATAALTVTKIETVNVNIASTTAKSVDATNFSGVSNLTVTRSDVSVAGSTITGDKSVGVTRVNATNVAKVTTGAGTTGAVTVDQTLATAVNSIAGVTLDATTATGAVTLTGAGTVLAGASTTTVTVQAINAAVTTQNAKAVSIDAANAATIAVSTNTELLTGAVTINAAKASSVTIDNAVGGATVNAGTTSTLDTTIAVSNIDASGATITTGTGSSTAAEKQIAINLDGTALTSDVATVSAAGYVSLDANTAQLVDTVNLSGNGAAVTYAMVSSAPTAINLTGAQSVTVSNNATDMAAATVTDTTTAGTTTAKLTTIGAAGTYDMSLVATDKIELAADGANSIFQLATAANIVLANDQSTGLEVAGKAAGATINITTADDTAANGTTIDLTVATFTADTNVTTLNIDATVGKFTATSTVLDVAATTATTLNIVGTKAVALGTTSAKTVNAGSMTAALSATVNGASATTSLTSGAGNDVLVFNDTNSTATVYTVDAGNGNNDLTITNAKVASSFATGTGTDTVLITAATAIVVATGEGNDTVSITADVDSDAIIVGGAGTADVLKFLDTDGNAFNGNTNFNFSGFETLNIAALTSGTINIDNADFAAQTLTVLGDAAADLLTVTGTANADTIDASNVTVTTAALSLVGAAGADIITGSAYNDTIDGGVGADTISGGDGTDTYVAVTSLDGSTVLEGAGTGTQTGMVINLSAAAITNTTILGAGTGYTADTVTSVASNTAAYLYAASVSTQAATVDTFSSIENATGSAGADYIVGSVGANTINAGAGTDYVKGGLGADTIDLGAADAVIDTLVFEATASTNGADTVTSFKIASGGDVLNFNAFLGNASDATIVTDTDGTAPTATTIAADSVLVLVDIAGAEDILTASGLTTALAAGGEYVNYNMGNNAQAIAVTYAGAAATVGKAFYLESDGAGVITATLVGTITADATWANAHTGNFA
jgi:hypothetical protein